MELKNKISILADAAKYEGGYMHLKTVAGCSQDLLNKACLYADPGGQPTQMTIGMTSSSGRDIMTKASNLYGYYNLKRVYYSAFSPIPDSAPNLSSSPPPMIREHRLYQTDWLLRFYGFNVDEVLPADVPELDLRLDPKLSWAIRNRTTFPVDLNVATRDILLRIPGLGVRNVDKILATKKFQKIRLTDLSKMRVHLDKIRPFAVTQNCNPPVIQLDSLHFAKFFRPETHVQLDFFSSLPVSVTGEF